MANNKTTRINYCESSPNPLPSISYRKPRTKCTAIQAIYFPEFCRDNKLWVRVEWWDDAEVELYPIATACHKFIGDADKGEPSLKQWIVSYQNTKWMTPELWNAFQEAITITVTPKYPIGAICMIINDDLRSLISYVMIIAHNSDNCCDFDNVDDLLLYFVQHIDLRSDKKKKFNKTSGKEFDLERPKGWVTECSLMLITNLKYIGMPEILWMQSQLHYYKILAESNAEKSKIVTSLFMETINVLFSFVAARIRGTLHLRNEGKIKSFTFHVAKVVMDSVLNRKFREIKKLKKKEKFKRKGISTFFVFNHPQSEVIIKEENANRDFDQNGREIFPMDMSDGNEIEPNYTMSISALMIRFYSSSEKIVTSHNVVRLDSNDDMYGQTAQFWKKHASKFDSKDFRALPDSDPDEP